MQVSRMELSYFLRSTLVQVMCYYRKTFNKSVMFLEEWVTPTGIITIIKWNLKSAVQSRTHQDVSFIILHKISLQSACLWIHAWMFPTIYILKKIFIHFQNSDTRNSDVFLKTLLLRLFCLLLAWWHLWLSHRKHSAYSP